MTKSPKEKDHLTSPVSDDNTSATSCQQNTLVNNTIQAKRNWFLIFSNCIVFKPGKRHIHVKPHEYKPRGKITHFSKMSRFRLFELLAKIKNKLEVQPIFATLTYHHGHQNSKTSTKCQLHNFLTQLRNFDPDVQFIWRIELQSRGAPHYHLIIFPGRLKKDVYKENYDIRIGQIWHCIADPNSYRHKEYGCRLITINNYREACSYVSKYVAKHELDNTESIQGKHWGCSRQLPIKAYYRLICSDKESAEIIEKIRKWLLQNGKEKYADPDYLNVNNETTVFIDLTSIENICLEHFSYELSPPPLN
ncbi:hypothetical protein ES705_33042 [subsurface metagenome]